MIKYWRMLKTRGMRGVTVLGDVLRPNAEGVPGGVDGQIAWLHLALRYQVQAACGLAPKLLSPTECPTLHGLIAAERSPANAAGYWAARHAAPLPNSPIRDLLEERLAGQFCIGYELPPYLTLLLDGLRVPYLDLRIHPVRFLDDLLFAAHPSDSRMAAPLAEWAMPRSLAWNGAGLHQAAARLQPTAQIHPGTLLVIGQRPSDATQVAGGDFFSATTVRDKLKRLCPAEVPVLLKDHPSRERHSLVTEMRAVRPDARFTNEGIYRLLADPGIGHVLTVNSSVAYEAAFFDKTVTTLLPPPVRLAWRGDATRRKAHVTIGDAFLNTDFWRGVLTPFTEVTAKDGFRLPPQRNRLRTALGEFWGFRDADNLQQAASGGSPPVAGTRRRPVGLSLELARP